jgi:DNA-binding response OmpR family regulator
MNPTDKKTILVVEDDPKTAALVALYLEREGFETQVARDGSEAMSLAERHGPVLIILDIMLPRMDGWEVFRRLRRRSDVPVIMLTARGEEVDRVAGLTLGADDYVVKPFSPRELVARVQTVLRRTARPQTDAGHLHIHEDLVLDTDKRRLTLAGETVPITPHEYAQNRAEPVQAPAHHHRPRIRLPVRRFGSIIESIVNEGNFIHETSTNLEAFVD